MKTAFEFHRINGNDRLLRFDLALSFNSKERVKVGGHLYVNAKNIRPAMTLVNPTHIDRKKTYDDNEPWDVSFTVDKDIWRLSGVQDFCAFDVEETRKAWVLLKNIRNEIENAYILKYPVAPFKSLIKTFDFQVEVPPEIGHMGFLKRAILVE